MPRVSKKQKTVSRKETAQSPSLPELTTTSYKNNDGRKTIQLPLSRKKKNHISEKKATKKSNEHNEDPSFSFPTIKVHGEEEGQSSQHAITQNKIDFSLSKIETLSQEIQFLVNTMNGLKSEILKIKSMLLSLATSKPDLGTNTKPEQQQNNEINQQPIESPPTSPVTAAISAFRSPSSSSSSSAINVMNESASIQGIFPNYKPTDRIVPRPSTKDITDSVGGKAHSLQFTVNLYVSLIEKVLGPPSKEKVNTLDYRAMVKEAVLVTKALLCHIKEVHGIDPHLKWSQVDPVVKLEAYKALEEATDHLLPLKVCSEYWGAHVLISNFWLKRKKTYSTIKKKKEKGAPVQNDLDREEQQHYQYPHYTRLDNITNNTSFDSASINTNSDANNSSNSSSSSSNGKSKPFSISFLTNQ